MKASLMSIAAGFLLALCVSRSLAQSSKLEDLRVSFASFGVIYYPHFVAKELGYYRDEGLNVEMIAMPGGLATQALVAGDPPIVNIGTVVQASLQGYNLVLVAAVETKYDQIVFARKGINKLEELKGKKFGISGYG